MKSVLAIAILVILGSIGRSTFAVTPMTDHDLECVSGQSGVSILAELNITIGNINFGNGSQTNTAGLNSLSINGTLPLMVDVQSSGDFLVDMNTLNTGVSRLATSFYNGGNIIKVSVPTNIATNGVNLFIGGASLGGINGTGTLSLTNVKLDGSALYIMSH